VTEVNNLQSFFRNHDFPHYINQWDLNGNPVGGTRDSLGQISMNGVSSLVATNQIAWDFVDQVWSASPPTGQFRYYDGMLYMMAMLHMSGNFKAYPSGVGGSPTPTVRLTPTPTNLPPTLTPTPTRITPTPTVYYPTLTPTPTPRPPTYTPTPTRPPPTWTPTLTPTPPATGWTWCANENGICRFNGIAQVRYGAKNSYYYKTTRGQINCNNATFGDPLHGVFKHCDYRYTALPTNTPVPPTPLPTIPGSYTYLSDMQWTGATNVTRDRTINGNTLRLNGVSYTKGLGTQAFSSANVIMGGRCSTLMSDIGVDDEVGNSGAVQFVIYGDGSQLYQSPTLTGASQTVQISVNVAGKQYVELRVNDAGGGTNDHADWANARVVCQ
jgi:hypothetical protein